MAHEHHGQHQHHGGGHAHQVHFEAPEMVAHAELEGEVHAGVVDRAATVVGELLAERHPGVGRIVDVGCGPAVHTCRLAERFAGAHVLAADGSAAMLDRARDRVERLGLAARVETRPVELPDGIESLGSADLVWASMVLHHLGDEVAGLRRIRALLEPDGLLAVVERARPVQLRFGDDDPARTALLQRLEAASDAWFDEMRAELPGAEPSDDYRTMIERAGFEVVVDEVVTVDLEPPLVDRAREYLREQLTRMRDRLGDHAAAADLAALDALLDDGAAGSVARRRDVGLSASRHLYVARALAPAGSPEGDRNG